MKRKRVSTTLCNLIDFIPEGTDTKYDKKKTNNKDRSFYNVETDGCETKTFYESLLKEKPDQCSVKIHGVKKTQRKERLSINNKKDVKSISATSFEPSQFFKSQSIDPFQRQHFKLLQYSQTGNKRMVLDLLSKEDLDANFVDFYGWTALMCAAKEGHGDVVKVLLESGAQKDLVNSSGDTAVTLATKHNHSATLEVLKNWRKNERDETSTVSNSNPGSSSQVFHCSVCKAEFPQSEASSHETSTLHLFNRGFKSKTPAYLIPDSNRGFQMMLRSGWDAKSGLGPDGSGVKYPIKTVLKHDRAGLGDEDVKWKKAKVTHFGRQDVDAVKFQNNTPTRQMSVRKIAQVKAKSKLKKAKRWEQNLRYELS